jgi:hypothetical protein
MDIPGIRQALVDAAVAAVPALHGYPYVPQSPELPCIYCGPPSYDDWSFNTQATVELVLTLCVSRADETVAEQTLDELASTGQIQIGVTNAQRIHWVDVAVGAVDNTRAASFGESVQVLAIDHHFSIRTK